MEFRLNFFDPVSEKLETGKFRGKWHPRRAGC